MATSNGYQSALDYLDDIWVVWQEQGLVLGPRPEAVPEVWPRRNRSLGPTEIELVYHLGDVLVLIGLKFNGVNYEPNHAGFLVNPRIPELNPQVKPESAKPSWFHRLWRRK